MFKGLLILGGLIFILPAEIFGQRHVERHWNYDPMRKVEDDYDRELKWFPDFSGWAEFGKFAFEKDTSHEYHHQLGAVMEMARWGNNSIGFSTQVEFIYDPNNEIDFNPRSIFWEEGIVYTRDQGDHRLQLQYMHRCKHDIDNLELGHERVTINASLGSRWIMPNLEAFGGDLGFSPGLEVYTITYDRRLPSDYQHEGLSWYQLLGAFDVRFQWQESLTDDINYFAQGYGKALLYGEGADEGEELDAFTRFDGYEETRFSGSLSTGLEIDGKAGNFRVGMRYEYLDDAAINPDPEEGSLFSFYVQAFSPDALF